jgi:hypothetical protein
MANNLSDLAETRILDWINVVGTPTRPTGPLMLALYTVAPNIETGAGGTEVTGGSYARTSFTMTAAASGSAENDDDITFPTATADWGTIVAGAIFDSAGSPVMLWSGNFASSKAIETGDVFKVPAGSLTVSLD